MLVVVDIPILHRSNDTGHWRGSNDLRKISVRIVSGHCPPGRDSVQFAVGKL